MYWGLLQRMPLLQLQLPVHMNVWVCVRAHVCVYAYVCVRTCVYVCAHVCMCVLCLLVRLHASARSCELLHY
jgi:hypothetical protein